MNSTNKITVTLYKKIPKTIFLVLLLLFNAMLFAQQITVLPGNNNYSSQSGPQGALRTQRQFYLIMPKEMKASGLAGGTVINKIGFTIGVAQNINTKGSFKVWLQNTANKISRFDSSWKEVTTGANTYSSRFFPGDYEVQVIPLLTCPIVADTALITFSNRNLAACQPPTDLKTTVITATSATFNWTAPANAPTQYKILYKNTAASAWTSATTASTFYNATGLTQNTSYQWRVWSDCSGDSSEIAATNFTTAYSSQCNPPTALNVFRLETSLADTLAVLKWDTTGTSAQYFSINYRRVGTANWITTLSFSDSVVIRHLVSGTTYEWQVKTNCLAGSGSFQQGPNFTTLGTARCYAPYNLSVNTITDSTAVLAWDSYPGVTSHKIRYRLKGTIQWTDAINGMTLVHNDSLLIPNHTGLDSVSFNLGSPFAYTADSGLYVAWEYSRLTGPISNPNISVSTTVDTVLKKVNGLDSIKYALSFSSRSDSGRIVQDSILTNSDFRPETILGSASLGDSVAVLAVWTLGKTAPRFQDSIYISAQISNRTDTAKRYGVILRVNEQITNALRYTKTDSITVRGVTDTLITFYLKSSTILENDSVRVSIDPQGAENVTNNNSKGFLQSVNPSLLAYADATAAITQVGFDTSPGLLLTKYTMKGCGKVIAAQVFLTTSSKGHPIYAVIRDTAGVITQSSIFTPDSTQTNSYHSFYFPAPVSFQNEDFYIGLAQPASVTPYRPVGAQWENSVNRAGAFYKANLNGTGLVDSSGFGRLMIRAEIIPSSPQPYIDSAINGIVYLCSSGTRTLSAGSMEQRFADSVISYSSQNSNVGYRAIQALGTPDVFPATGTVAGAWLSEQPDSTRFNKHEFLALRFPNPAPINFVDIYETANPGAVDTVWVKNSLTLNYDTVFTRIPDTTLPNVARKYHVSFPLTPNPVSEIKISLNSGKIPGYNAIDAVAIGKSTVPATYSNYLWTGPGIVGASNTQSITINAIGSYKVEVTTATGCPVSSDSVSVINVPVSVSVTPAGPITLCFGDSIWLKSSIHGGNTWSTGSTSDSIKVKTTGVYSLSNNVGCGVINSNSVTVTALPKLSVRITGNLSICPSSSTLLDAGSGYALYTWKNAAGTVLSSAQTCTVTNANAGLIKVIVDSVGCKDSATVFTINVAAPTPLITGNLQFCAGDSTTLDGGAFSSYEWRNQANIIVGTNRTINVLVVDSFSVKVSNAAGCFGTSPKVGTSLFTYTPPTIAGNSSFCPGGSVTITASAGYISYVWRNGVGTTVGTNQILTVNIADTYTVTATAANGCSGTASKTITLSPVPTPVITGVFVFCPGGDSTTLHAGPGYASYIWRNGIGATIGTDSTVNVYSAESFTVTVTNAAGCSGTSPAINTTLFPFTPPTISGNSSFCGGTSVTLTASAGYVAYLWKNGLGATVGNSQTLIVNTADTYTVTVTAANGCKGSVSKTVVQTPLPHPVISGALQFCAGSSTTLNAGPGYASYIWKNAAGVVLSTTQTVVVTIPGLIKVIVDSLGCTDSTTAITTTLPAPTPVITGSLQFCAGSSTILNAGAGYSSYLWSPGGATTQTITVNTAGTFTVTVSNAAGCSGTSPSVTTVLLPVPTPIITGNSTFCPGNNVTLTANAGYTNYLWSPGGATTPSITVNIAGTYTVTVTDANGCTGSASKTISQAPAAVPSITGALSFCAGSSTTLNAGAGFTSYSWSPGGATTQSITVNTAGTFTVTVTNASGCSGTASAITTVVNGVPSQPGPITGPVIGLCNTTGNVYSISPVPNTDFYVWTVPSGATIIGPINGTSITVNYGNLFNSGVITVAAINICGPNPINNPRQLAVTGVPPAAGPISGPINGLCLQTGIVYSIAPVFSATTYTWTVPSGVVITSGQGTNSITVNFVNSFIDGIISVLPSNACASSVSSSLSVQGATAIPGTISGATIGDCRLENQVYTIAPVSGAVSYTWTVPSRVTILEGQGTTSVKVKFDDDFVTGDICVYTNSSCGRSLTRCLTVFESPCPDFIFYPNPTPGITKFLVKFGPYGKYKLQITNALTQVVYQREFIWSGTDLIIDLSVLPSGVYDVTIFNDTYYQTKKMLKIN